MSVRQLVCFRIGKETFGADIFAVREIVRRQEITQVPGTPEFVLGVINLRGRILSVIDLGQRLGFGPTEAARTSRILVTQLGGATVGFFVDAATEVLRLSLESIEPAPAGLAPVKVDYLEGVGKVQDRLVILLNLDRVLSGGELPAALSAASA